jgi:hypothetical protein
MVISQHYQALNAKWKDIQWHNPLAFAQISEEKERIPGG